MADLEKKIVIPVEANTSPADKKIDKFKKDTSKHSVEIPIEIDLSDIKKAMHSIEGMIGKISSAFDKDVKFSGLQKGLDDVYGKIDKIIKETKNGTYYINVNPLGFEETKKQISSMTRNIELLNGSKIDLDSFNRLADVLENIETLVNSIVKGMNFDNIRPSTQVQEDIESTTEQLEKLAKTEEKIKKIEKYLNNTGIKQGRNVIEWGDSEEVSETTLKNIIKAMKEYISLGGDLSKITFKAFNVETETKELYSLIDVLEILEDEGKVDIIDESKMSNDYSTIKKLRNELTELNKELTNAKNRENRDLNVSLDTKSIEEFTASITEAFKKIENLNINIPEGFTFDELSTENLDKILNKFDEMVASIKGISDILSTGVDTSKLKNIEVNVEPKVDASEFIKKIEGKLKGAVVEVKTNISEEEPKTNESVLVDDSVFSKIKEEFKLVSDDFGTNLQTEIDQFKTTFSSVMESVDYENLFSSLRNILLDIVTQFQNSLNTVSFSKEQVGEIYNLLKEWNEASSILMNNGEKDNERAAFISQSTGSVSNSYLYDKATEFSGKILTDLSKLSAGVSGQIGEIYDTWIHQHPFRNKLENLSAIGSDIGFTPEDLEVFKKYLKSGITNMMVSNKGKFANIDWSGITEAQLNQVIKEFRASNIFDKDKFVGKLAQDNGKYNFDKQSELMNQAILNAMKAAKIDNAEQRFTVGNIDDLKVDMVALQQAEQEAKNQAEQLLSVLTKLNGVLSGSVGELQLGISEQALSGIIEQLKEIADLIRNFDVSKLTKSGKEIAKIPKSISLTQTFDNDMQRNLVYLENYKNTIAEIDRLKLEPETDETIQKMKELNSLADYYVSQIDVIRSENGHVVSAEMMQFSGFWNETLKKYPHDKAQELYKLASEKYGLPTNLEIPQFTVIGDEIASIESKSESLRVSLGKALMESNKYVADLRGDFLALIRAMDELQTETSPRWINEYKEDINEILSKHPELEQFKDKFTADQAKEFIKTDSWNEFLATLPQAQKYLESIGYEQKNTGTKLKIIPDIDVVNIISDIQAALNSEAVKVHVEPDIDTANFVSEVQSVLNQESIRVQIIPDISSNNSSSTDVGTTGMAHESALANELREKVESVTTAVDLKTRAFQEEEQIVVGTVQREVTNLEVLDGQLLEIINTIEKIKTAFNELDFSSLTSSSIDNGLDNMLSNLGTQLQGLDIEALSRLSDVLNGLNIPADASNNLVRVATALGELKNRFAEISVGENGFLSSINAILSKTDELQNLLKILESSERKIKRAGDAVNAGSGTGSVNKDEVLESIRKKKEELADCELQAERFKEDLDKLSETVKNRKLGYSASNRSQVQLDHVRDSLARRIFGEPDSGGIYGSKKWMAFGNLDNLTSSNLKSYQMMNEELLKAGYKLGEIRQIGKSMLEADIIPIDENAITNAEEFKNKLSSIQTVADLANLVIEQMNTTISNLRNEINSLEASIAPDLNAGGVQKDTEAMSAAVNALKKDIESLQGALKKSFKDDGFSTLKFIDSLEDISKRYKSLKAINDSDPGKVTDANMQSLTAYFRTFKDAIGKMSLDSISTENKVPEFIAQLDQAKNQLEEVKVVLDKVEAGEAFTDEDIAKIKQFVAQFRELNKASKGRSNNFANTSKVQGALGQIAEILSKNTAMSKELRQEFEALQAEMKAFGGNIPIDISTEFGHRLETLKTQMNEGKTGLSFFDGIAKKAKSMSQNFIGMYLSLYDVVRYVRTGITHIRDFDTALTEMRKVSDESVSSLKNFQTVSFDIAGSVGTTAKQIQNSTADFMRIGESLNEAADSAKVSNILLNVSEFESIDEATNSLVAMSAAYSELDKIEIVDKLNNIGNNFAISTDGLATALQKSASALKTAGNDMDEAIALVTAGNQVVQDPDSVGAGLRTIALRITGTEAAKQELESLGEDTSDFLVQTSAKSQQAIKDFTKVASNNFEGFDILDDNGNFKSTYEILSGISEIYQEIVETDKQYGSNMANGLLETLAGKNRANIAASILQNPDILKSVYESSQDSDGSAQKELDSYLDSIEGKISRFQNELQEFWYNLISSDTIKTIVDIGTAALDIIGDIVGALGEAGTLVATITTALNIKSFLNGGNGILSIFRGIKNEVNDITSMLNNNSIFNGNIINSGINSNILSQLNMGYNKDGSMTSSYSNAITNLASSYTEATAEANALKMAQDGLSESTIKDILAKQNWTQAEINAAVGSQSFRNAQTAASAATHANTASTLKNVAAKKALATATSVVKNAALGLATAFAAIAIEKVIEGFVKLADEAHQSREELKEAAEEIRNSYQSAAEEISSDLDMIHSVEDEFNELSKGVSTYGENISLTSDEYERYKDIVADIIDTNPALVEGFNDEGEAIANKNTLLQASIDLLKEKQKIEREEYTSDDSIKTLGRDAVEDINDYKKENPLPYGNAKYDFMKSFASAADRYDADNKYENNYELFEALSPEGYNWNDYGSGYTQAQNFASDYFEQIVADLRSESGILKDYFNSDEVEDLLNFANQYDQNVARYNSRIDNYSKGLNPTLQLVAQFEDGYNELSDSQKSFLTAYINGFRITSETTEEEMVNMKYDVQDLVEKIKNGTYDKLTDAFDLQEKFDANEINISEYQEGISSLLDSLEEMDDIPEEVKKNIKLIFDIETSDDGNVTSNVDTMIEQVRNVLENEFDDKVGELTLNDLKIAANLSVYLEENSINFKELETQIENYKYLGRDGFIDSRDILGDLGIKYTLTPKVEVAEVTGVMNDIVGKIPDPLSKNVHKELFDNINPFEDTLFLDESFLNDIDEYISKTNQLKVAMGKINDGSWTKGDFDKLAKDFKELKDVPFDEIQTEIVDLQHAMDMNMISEFTEQFGKVKSAEDRAELEKYMRVVTKLGDVVGNTQFSISITTESESYQNLATAMAESISATGLSSESVKNLRKRYSDLEAAGYDVESMFETTTNGVHLNREAFNKLEDVYKSSRIDQARANLKNLENQYKEVTEQINNCKTASELAGLYSERESLSEQIREYGMLASQLEGLYSSYNAWQTEQSAGNERDMYEGVISGFKEVKDEMSRGWFDDDTVAFLELLTGKNISSLPIEEQIAAYEKLGEKINSAGYSVKDFFTTDKDGNSTATGVFNFLDTINANEKLGDAVTVDKDGNYSFDFKLLAEYDDDGTLKKTGDQVIAEALGISEELVQIMLRAADDAGFVVNLEGAFTQFSTLREEAQAADIALKDFFDNSGKKYDFEFDFSASSVESITSEYEEALTLLDKFRNEDGTLLDTDEAKHAADIAWYFATALDRATQPTYMNLDASQVDEEFKEPLEKLQRYDELLGQERSLEIDGDPNGELQKVQEEMEGIVDYISNNDELKAQLKIEGASEEEIEEMLKNGTIEFPATADVELKIGESIEDISTMLQYNLGLISETEMKLRLGLELTDEEQLQQQINELSAGQHVVIESEVEGEGVQEVYALMSRDGETIRYRTKIDGEWKELEKVINEDGTYYFEVIPNVEQLENSMEIKIANYDQLESFVNSLNFGDSAVVNVEVEGEGLKEIQLLKEDGEITYTTVVEGEIKELEPYFKEDQSIAFRVKPASEESVGFIDKVSEFFGGTFTAVFGAEDNVTPVVEEINEEELEDKEATFTTHYTSTTEQNPTLPPAPTPEQGVQSEMTTPQVVEVTPVLSDDSGGWLAAVEEAQSIVVEVEGDEAKTLIDLAREKGKFTLETEVDGETKILELAEKEEGLVLRLQAKDEVSPILDELKAEEVEAKIVELVGEDNATPVIEIWNALSVDPKFATLSGEDQATAVVEYWNSLTPEVKEAFINGTFTMTDATEEGTDSANENIGSVPLETNPVIKANDLTSSTVTNITNSLNVLNGKTAHTYIITHKKTVTESEATGTAHAYGTAYASGTFKVPYFNAHADGTAMSMWRGYRSSIGAYAQGNDWALPKDENALVNEIGTESIVRDGRWFPIPGGAHVEQLKKGDIIFSAAQTEELIKTGKVISGGGHGRVARADGTAFNTLNAFANGTAFSGMSAYYGSSGYGPGRTTVSSGNGSVSKNSSSKNNSQNNNNNKNNSSDSAEEFEETLDWIEVKIARIEREIENLDQKASATYKSWSTRNKALVSEMSKISDEIAIQQAGYKRYLEEANSVGLSDEYKKLVQSGEIDIDKITDEDLANKIQEYTEWYEKAIECKDATEDLKDTLAELARQKFDNVSKQYEDKLSAIEHEANIVDALISKTEASGHIVSSKYYDELIKQEQKTNSSLHKEYAALQAELAEAMETGNIKKGSEEWYAMQAEINAVQEAIIESDTAIIEFNNNIRQLEWDAFDRLQEQISNVATEAEFLIGLMEDSKLYDDNGQLTDTGMATMGLHGQNYATYMHQADKYAKEMKEIDKDLAKDPGNQDLIERRQELLELQRDSINAANDEKMAIRDMVEEGINLELEALQERIDKYKEAQEEAKSLYDYQKNISDQVKEISSLEKQMTAYQGDNSEENKQRVQQLKVQLEEARENLEETEMDHALEESQKMLDKLYEDYEEILNERLDNIDMLLEDMIDKINTNSSDISNTISEEADKVGYTLSESMRNIWSNEGDAAVIISKYGDNFCAQLTSVNNVLNAIAEHMGVMLKQEDKNAKSEIKKNQDKAVEPKKEESSNKTETTKKEDTKKENTKTIKVGGKINAGSAQIYDYAGDKSGERQYFRNDPIYTVLKESGDWIQVRHHKANSGIDGWFKKSDVKAYKTGGLVDETGLAWLDGTKGKPEMVLNAQDTKNLIELTDTLRKLSDADISSMMSNVPMFDSLTPIAPNFVPNNMAQNMNNIFNMTFELHDVTNGEQVINYLIKSDRFENAVKAMTVDRLAGGSKFSKSKYVK